MAREEPLEEKGELERIGEAETHVSRRLGHVRCGCFVRVHEGHNAFERFGLHRIQPQDFAEELAGLVALHAVSAEKRFRRRVVPYGPEVVVDHGGARSEQPSRRRNDDAILAEEGRSVVADHSSGKRSCDERRRQVSVGCRFR
jgi:hypothetical protein